MFSGCNSLYEETLSACEPPYAEMYWSRCNWICLQQVPSLHPAFQAVAQEIQRRFTGKGRDETATFHQADRAGALPVFQPPGGIQGMVGDEQVGARTFH